MERLDRLGSNGSLGGTYSAGTRAGDAERANCVWGTGDASSLQAALAAVEPLVSAQMRSRKINDAGG